MYKNGFLKVMAATPKIVAGNINNNEKEIIKVLNNSDAGVIVFPELALTGYSVSDLFYQEFFIKETIDSLKNILAKNKHEGIAVIGMPLDINGGLFNVGVIIQKNNILGVVPKYYLPNNQEFQEKRWFLSGFDATFTEVRLFSKMVPFGNIIFKEESKNISLGVEICQDLWSIISPADDLVMAGANVLLNLSASTELVYKEKHRRNAILDHTRKQVSAYIYTTTGIYESSSEAVFSSHKLIASMGEMIEESAVINYEADSIVADINIDAINFKRRQDTNYREAVFKNEFEYQEVFFNLTENEQYEFYKEQNKLPFSLDDYDKNKVLNILTAALVKKLSFLPKNLQKIVIGLSGGLDSTHALIVAHNAFKIMKLPLKDIIAVIMPAEASSNNSKSDALELAKLLKVTHNTIEINETLNRHLKDINHHDKDVTYENAQARIRTLILMDLANKYEGIVLGTGDLSEIALGFMTYNGDQMSMYAINAGVPKTLMKELVLFYANNEYSFAKDVLNRVAQKKISPELLKGQETEDIIGSYEINDFIMYHHLNQGMAEDNLIWLVEGTFKTSLVEAANYVKRFLNRFYSQQFKRASMPEGPKIFDISLSPRLSYRMPSDIVRK
ncbi:MAG: NAD(+) synthase [Acholeplasma sp.]|nr:NAD(+) synthase [Acholeplasma sp.]